MGETRNRLGLWLIGVCGGVGSTVALGLAALAKRRADSTGLVSELPPFHNAGLPDPANMIIGGHEIRRTTFLDSVVELHQRSNLFDTSLIRECTPALKSAQKEVRPGTLLGSSKVVRDLASRNGIPRDQSVAEAVERLASDIDGFRRRKRLADCIVINVASTEPPIADAARFSDWKRLQKQLTKAGSSPIPTSVIYAIAAIRSGCPYINFTPSTGIGLPALERLAQENELPYMGNDGKTGETLIKSALAPMFAMRNLEILSWFGQNILGNRDGAVLNDPATRQSKIHSKDGLVARIVGGSPVTKVGIDYIPSLDDWKVAWDFVHFRGFLGTKMSLQFSWCGSDSVLAAPLVIDLARFGALEHARGGVGPMRHLAFFFKNPMGVNQHDLNSQWLRLVRHVGGVPHEARL